MPWAAYEQDSRGIVVRDSQNNPKLTGYCVEFVEEMSKKMNFEYELIVPTDGSETYGSKSRYEHQSTVSFFHNSEICNFAFGCFKKAVFVL